MTEREQGSEATVEGLMELVVKLADAAHSNGCEQGATRGYTMDRSSESAIESAILQYAERLSVRPVAQPANTDSASGSPGSESTRPDQPKLPESGGIGVSSIGLGAEGEQ